jgi:hypothetical protein
MHRATRNSLGLTVALLVTCFASSAMAQGKTVKRPIGDWIAAQGSKMSSEWSMNSGPRQGSRRVPPGARRRSKQDCSVRLSGTGSEERWQTPSRQSGSIST